jgi:hypothetical protein
VQISGTVASADAECHCSDQQVCLGFYFLRGRPTVVVFAHHYELHY